MNKFVKLPLFLGVSGAICAGLLAVVNGITAPIVEKRLENEKNANYLALMSIDSADEFKDGKVTDDLKAGFVTGIKEVYVGGSLLGVVYDGALNDGFSDWTLQLGIKDGKFTGRIVSPVILTGYVPDLLKSIFFPIKMPILLF